MQTPDLTKMLIGKPRKKQLRPALFRTVSVKLVASACLLLVSCSQAREVAVDSSQWLNWHPALKGSLQRDAVFEFEITPDSNGRYELTGKTELPEGSRLAIAAVRYLKLDPKITVEASIEAVAEEAVAEEVVAEEATTEEAAEERGPERLQSPNPQAFKRFILAPTYAILDYEQTEVRDGQWAAQLDLWQVARDGRYQESWQLDQEELKVRWKPEPDVIFLATLVVDGAADRLQPIQDKLAERHLSLSSTLIQTSLEGEQYFQSAQLQSIDLPDGKTAPPGLRVQDINGGWGERYLLVEQDPLPGTLEFPVDRNSNAPGSPKEFIQ